METIAAVQTAAPADSEWVLTEAAAPAPSGCCGRLCCGKNCCGTGCCSQS